MEEDKRVGSPDGSAGRFFDLVEDTIGQLMEFLPEARRAKFEGASQTMSFSRKRLEESDSVEEVDAKNNASSS